MTFVHSLIVWPKRADWCGAAWWWQLTFLPDRSYRAMWKVKFLLGWPHPSPTGVRSQAEGRFTARWDARCCPMFISLLRNFKEWPRHEKSRAIAMASFAHSDLDFRFAGYLLESRHLRDAQLFQTFPESIPASLCSLSSVLGGLLPFKRALTVLPLFWLKQGSCSDNPREFPFWTPSL